MRSSHSGTLHLMPETAFVVISALYVCTLSLIDGLFNRLIFRSKRALPYTSPFKQRIYKRKEWRAIGVLLLIVLPLILPLSIAFLVGGVPYMVLYAIALLLVPWDIIFGRLVFNDYWGDTPSIALPYVGWLQINLALNMFLRLTGACALMWGYLTYFHV